MTSFEEFQGRGSGWSLDAVQNLELKLAAYQPFASSSYVPLPKVLAAKKAVLNIQNEDEQCLVWCVLAALHPVDPRNAPHRTSHYEPFVGELNVSGISFPTPLHQLSRFERLNSLSINVFGWENGEVLPLRITTNKQGKCCFIF